MKAKIICLMTLVLISSKGLADEGVSYHNNAHTVSGASELYQNWLDNKTSTNDPFYRLTVGYEEDKSNANSALFETTVYDNVESYLANSRELMTSSLDVRRALRDLRVYEAYDNAKIVEDDSVTFDHDAYYSDLETYYSERATLSGLYYEERQNNIAQVSVGTISSINDINERVLSNSVQATFNVVNLMKEKMSEARSDIYNSFSDNFEAASSAREQGVGARELAADFNNECAACTFETEPEPEPEAPVEPEPTPEPTAPEIDSCYATTNGRGESMIYYECP